ncbi:hypothetical protein BUALT_Bualt04G0107100 [Buddleja alternifolia]|uniref:Cytochrome P450 n=1 Tax=Buddleja alternifolia TaxID=168488 RepID=A0AAV6XUP1_9LAMI|nr:hypothetical protein BUALT_Bualt04G0107100 [Buddleja alternifolia]
MSVFDFGDTDYHGVQACIPENARPEYSAKPGGFTSHNWARASLEKLPTQNTIRFLPTSGSHIFPPVRPPPGGGGGVILLFGGGMFQQNDLVLANRPQASVDRKSLGFSSTTLCDLEVFAPTRLASFLAIRRDEMNRAIFSLCKMSEEEGGGFAKVDLESKIVEMTFNNIILRMVAGKRYYGEEAEDDEEAKRFRELTKEALELTSASNPSEIFPIVRWIGMSGLEKKMAIHSEKTDKFMQGLLDEHRRGERQNTMVDHLLSLQLLNLNITMMKSLLASL